MSEPSKMGRHLVYETVVLNAEHGDEEWHIHEFREDDPPLAVVPSGHSERVAQDICRAVNSFDAMREAAAEGVRLDLVVHDGNCALERTLYTPPTQACDCWVSRLEAALALAEAKP